MSNFYFPACRGIQAGRHYYNLMVPIQYLAAVLQQPEDAEEIPVEMRHQRTLNKKRARKIADYVIDNPNEYVLSSLAVSVDRVLTFQPSELNEDVGILEIPTDATFQINDGQHRNAALALALEAMDTLGIETISICLYVGISLARSQQMYASLNMGVSSPAALNLLYDAGNKPGQFAKKVILRNPIKALVELEKTSPRGNSPRLFSLTAACAVHRILFASSTATESKLAKQADAFWTAMLEAFPTWEQVKNAQRTAKDERTRSAACTAVGLAAIATVMAGEVGKRGWQATLKKIGKLDWDKSSLMLAGRCVRNGRMSKSAATIALTAIAIKKKLDIALTDDETAREAAFQEELAAIETV